MGGIWWIISGTTRASPLCCVNKLSGKVNFQALYHKMDVDEMTKKLCVCVGGGGGEWVGWPAGHPIQREKHCDASSYHHILYLNTVKTSGGSGWVDLQWTSIPYRERSIVMLLKPEL